MFLSHTVVPVFVFTVLFYLYSSTDSLNCPENYNTCKECLHSKCHTFDGGPCTLAPDNCTFQCFTCKADSKEKPQYYSVDECLAGCSGKMMECACTGTCYTCLTLDEVDQIKKCAIPTVEMDENCAKAPYYRDKYIGPSNDDYPSSSPASSPSCSYDDYPH